MKGAWWVGASIMQTSNLPGIRARLHISTCQYARMVREWMTLIGLEASAYGTYSMSRTKLIQNYKKTGNLQAVQLLLCHTKMDRKVRYLDFDPEDALAISEAKEIRRHGPSSRTAHAPAESG